MNQRVLILTGRIVVNVLVLVLVLLGLYWFDPVTWFEAAQRSVPAGPVRYQYLTFRWPRNTQAASLFYDCESTNTDRDPVPGTVTEKSLRLDEILERTRQVGYEYCGAVSDTIILRRISPLPPDAYDLSGPLFLVTPDRSPR